ncbi:MAG: hypothetical protein ACSHX6_14420 [Akkermansiaceae bacterium]
MMAASLDSRFRSFLWGSSTVFGLAMSRLVRKKNHSGMLAYMFHYLVEELK